MPLVKKSRREEAPAPTTRRRAQEEEEEQETTTTRAVDPESLIDDIIDEAREFSNPDPGTYPAIVDFIKIMPPNEKGQSIQVQFVLWIGEESENPIRRFSRFFRMVSEDLKTPDEWGPSFYNRLMAKLGYSKGDRGAKARAEVTEEKPGVVLKIKKNAKNDEFVDSEITGFLDDDNEDIAAIREELENQPV